MINKHHFLVKIVNIKKAQQLLGIKKIQKIVSIIKKRPIL